MRAARWTAIAASAWVLLAVESSQAANPAFQTFFFTVCGTANTGALATRCAETPGGTGNLSGDSESSLNPSQNLSHSQPSLASAESRGKQSRDRDDALRGGPPDSDVKVDIGPFSILAHVSGSSFERDINYDAERAYEGDERGFEAGFDYRLSAGTVLGLLVGTNHSEFDFAAENPGVNFTPQANAGDSEADTLYLTGFAAFALGSNGFIDAAIGYERGDYTLSRNPVFQESTRTIAQTSAQLTADAEGTTFWSSLNGGFDFGSRAFSGGVYGGLMYAKSDMDSYAERDVNASGVAMSFEATSRESLRAHAGVRAAYTFSTSHGIVVPQLRVEYQYEFEDDPDRIQASFLLDPDASEFEWTGAPRDADAVEVGFGISAAFANGWQPFFNVDLLLGSDDLERTRVTLGVRVEL